MFCLLLVYGEYICCFTLGFFFLCFVDGWVCEGLYFFLDGYIEESIWGMGICIILGEWWNRWCLVVVLKVFFYRDSYDWKIIILGIL